MIADVCAGKRRRVRLASAGGYESGFELAGFPARTAGRV